MGKVFGKIPLEWVSDSGCMGVSSDAFKILAIFTVFSVKNLSNGYLPIGYLRMLCKTRGFADQRSFDKPLGELIQTGWFKVWSRDVIPKEELDHLGTLEHVWDHGYTPGSKFPKLENKFGEPFVKFDELDGNFIVLCPKFPDHQMVRKQLPSRKESDGQRAQKGSQGGSTPESAGEEEDRRRRRKKSSSSSIIEEEEKVSPSRSRSAAGPEGAAPPRPGWRFDGFDVYRKLGDEEGVFLARYPEVCVPERSLWPDEAYQKVLAAQEAWEAAHPGEPR